MFQYGFNTLRTFVEIYFYNMKKITLLFSLFTLFLNTNKAQTINCPTFCVLNITIDTVGSNTLNVTIYNGDTINVNYPTVVVTNSIGDTVGNIDTAFFFFAQLAGDTMVHNIPTSLDSLNSGFTGIVYLRDGIYLSTCAFNYPMNCTVGIKESVLKTNSFSIFPNPATKTLNINLGNLNHLNKLITIYDDKGQLIKMITTTTNSTIINTEDLADGIYFITADLDGKRWEDKLVITH